MTNKTPDRNAELVAFFVSRCLGELGRTRLMKLLYLADYEARRYLGRPLSTLKYVWHYYGPFDASVDAILNKLKADGAIVETPVAYPSGKNGYLYSRGPQEIVPTFDPPDLAILSYVCEKYSAVSLRELLDEIVYQTEPMKAAIDEKAKNTELRMQVVDNAKANEFGVSFEMLLRRSWELRGGKSLSHQEAMRLVDDRVASLAA